VIGLLVALAAAALPEGEVRLRAEALGEAIGVATLAIRCAGEACTARYAVELRLPEEAGGALRRTRIEVEVDREGRWRGGPLRVERDGVALPVTGIQGAVPSSLVEVALLARAGGAGETCLDQFDEDGPAPGRACARREGGALRADVAGVPERIVPGADGFPAEVVAADWLRFVRDPEAAVPARAPRLSGTRVAGPADPGAARRFCEVEVDPPARSALPRGLPPPRAPGESCREKTAAWLAAASRAGFEGRTAVGVAWDGSAFVWHAWAEVRAGEAWVPIDPSFGEAPARGPRFTLGRFASGDAAARRVAGLQLLRCWGTARVLP
jgi:hypothetical protein